MSEHCTSVAVPWPLLQDKDSAYEVVKAVDKASGYIFGEGDDATMAMMSSAMGADFDFFKYPLFEFHSVAICN